MKRTAFVSAAACILSLILPGCATKAAAGADHALNDSAGCREAIAVSTSQAGLSVLVLRDGRIICEDYANGGGVDKGHEIWSGTKSFTGIAAAIMVKDGMLSLDERVSDTIAEWKSDPVKSTVTIRQLLSLTSGIGNEGQPGGRAPGYAKAIATGFTAKPGELFQYGPQSFQVFGELMQRKLKARGLEPDSRAFMKSRILDPIGMVWTDWRRTPEGDALMPQGSSFTAREWSKFGEFIRAGGVANGKMLVDPKAFKELFIGTKANPAYGISWWLPNATNAPDVVTASIDLVRHSTELPRDMVIAGGAGNQRMFIVPSCKLTVVRQAEFDPAAALAAGGGDRAAARRERTWSDFNFLKPILNQYCR